MYILFHIIVLLISIQIYYITYYANFTMVYVNVSIPTIVKAILYDDTLFKIG